MQKVQQSQRLLCLSQSEDKDDLLPAGWRDDCEVTYVRNPVKILSLLKEQTFDGVFVCSDSFRDVLGLGELIRDSQILKNLPDAVAMLDRDQKIVWWNEKITAWTETTELSGRRFTDCFSDTLLASSDEDPVHTAAMIGRQSVTRMKSQNGKFYDMIVSPILGRGGKTEQLIVVLRDVSKDELMNQKMNAIHKAGVELANLTPEEIFKWDLKQRIDALKASILHCTQQVMNYDYFEIRLIDNKTNELNVLLSEGINSERAQQPLYVSTNGQGVTGFVAATGQSYNCKNTAADHLYLDGLIGAGSCLVVPLIVHEHVIGTLNVESPAVNAFSESDEQFLEIYSYYIANSLNTFELLAAEGANSAQQHIQAIHKAVALPIDEILNEAHLVLEKFSHDPEVEARLRAILQKTREVAGVIHKATERVVSNAAIPDSLQQPLHPCLVGRRVLVVDQDTKTRDDAHQLLEPYGLIVETAHTGREALTMMRSMDAEQRYDCVLSEEHLDDMDGCELLLKMQPIFGVTSPPLVLLKGTLMYDAKHVMTHARQAGLRQDARIVKPLRQKQAAAMVERMIAENGAQDIGS